MPRIWLLGRWKPRTNISVGLHFLRAILVGTSPWNPVEPSPMITFAILAPERPITWASWLIWAIVCAFAFPHVATEARSRVRHLLPYFSWAQVRGNYDSSRETSFKGTIRKVHLFPFLNESTALGIELGRGKQLILVLIAPRGFLADQGVLASVGQPIEGMGSRRPWNDGELILAREIVLQGRFLKLRDEGGQHLWTVADSQPAIAKES